MLHPPAGVCGTRLALPTASVGTAASGGVGDGTAQPVEAEHVAVLLAGDCVLGTVVSGRIDFYDRATGKRVQTLAQESSLVTGGCLTGAGLIDIASRQVVCLRGPGR